ncbi:hypothetical protein FOZ60_006355, partial [Perkinsus olseni]
MTWLLASSLYMMYSARSNVVTFPFRDSTYFDQTSAGLVLDKQPLSLLVDSGTARLLVIYGKWFESVHAKNPCNDIETRKRFRVEFTADKEVYHYVQHTGALLAG